MIETFALIFRARGEARFGDTVGMIAWAFFTALQLLDHGHTPDWRWLLIDFLSVMALFTLGARPGWSRDCWPAWEKPGCDDPVTRDWATRNSVVRALWFAPLLAYVAARGGHMLALQPLAIAFFFGFALIMRWNDEVRVWARISSAQTWCVGELMLGAWLGFIQWGLSL